MMFRLIAGIMLCAGYVTSLFTAPAPILPDSVIVAYQLSANEEMQFSVSDTFPSVFWKKWDARPSQLDRIEMERNPGNGQNTVQQSGRIYDARVEARMAWGKKGLYCYYKVNDNRFVDIMVVDNLFTNDCIDFFIDTHSPDELASGSFWTQTSNQLTKSYVQFQQLFGDIEVPLFLSRNHRVDSLHRDVFEQYTHGDAFSKFGITIKVVQVGKSEKVQEWLLPWHEVGNGGMVQPQSGKKIGYDLFYNDLDGADESGKCLIWCGSPYGARQTRQWGTLEFGPVLDKVNKTK